ncbi:hypothetical protein [Methanobrevibacter sp.]
MVKDSFPLYIKGKINNLYSNIILLTNVLWAPALNGETGADYRHSYSESNGEAVGKGFLLKGGWSNEGLWEVTFEFKHDNIRYTGIGFIGTGFGSDGGFQGLSSWEGSWPGGTAYASYNSGTVGWFDVIVTKIDDTHLRLRSEILNRDTTVEWQNLATLEIVSIGARHNSSSSNFGPCRIRNVKVIAI